MKLSIVDLGSVSAATKAVQNPPFADPTVQGTLQPFQS
jgi:hypothetical protein